MNVWAANTSPINMQVGQANVSPINMQVGQANVSPIYVQVGQAIVSPINILVARAITSFWDLRGVVVGQAFTSLINTPVARAWMSFWDLRGTRVGRANDGSSSLPGTDPVRKAWSGSCPLPVGRAFHSPVSFTTLVKSSNIGSCAIPWFIGNANTAPIPMLDHDPVRSSFRGVMPLIAANVIISVQPPVIVHQGTTIELERGRVWADEDSYLWQAELVLANHEDYARIKYNDALTLTLGSEVYSLIVDGKDLDRTSPATVGAQIQCVSPSALLDAPRASSIDVLYEVAVTARQATEDIAGAVIDWQLVDWFIPAYRIAFDRVTPIEAIKLIAEAAGGVVDTNLDGQLRVRHRWPTSPKDYDTAVADQIYTDATDNLTVSERGQYQAVVDKLRIRDTLEGVFEDVIEYDGEQLSGILHVYPSPWRESVRLTHTGPLSINLLKTGTVTREEEELIEVVNGEGRCRYPIQSVLSLTWHTDNLTGISFEPGARSFTTTHPDKHYSLVTIRYQTKSIEYETSSAIAQSIQFTLEDLT